jgi:outer membrane protein OmpA-like peptidoglycan-associated protein
MLTPSLRNRGIINPTALGFVLACAAALALSSCASKKFVRNSVGPVEARVVDLESQTAEQGGKIAAADERHESDVSRLDERLTSVDDKAAAAGEAAEHAEASAQQADQAAAAAKEFAGSGLNELERTMIDMSRFRQVEQQDVLFGFDSSVLSADALKQLDSLATMVASREQFVFEIRGFTDSTGAADYNLRLSERRAEAVVRYLNSEHGIPLRAIHRIGLGQSEPGDDNKTREGRERNRRVEVTLYFPVAESANQLSGIN